MGNWQYVFGSNILQNTYFLKFKHFFFPFETSGNISYFTFFFNYDVIYSYWLFLRSTSTDYHKLETFLFIYYFSLDVSENDLSGHMTWERLVEIFTFTVFFAKSVLYADNYRKI